MTLHQPENITNIVYLILGQKQVQHSQVPFDCTTIKQGCDLPGCLLAY